jgi:AGZA family xanthine/uracil permease-like MFS transporter
MGHNFYFAFAAVPMIAAGLGEGASTEAWQIALGAVFISGAIFLLLSFTRFISEIIAAVPASLKNAIAVGIGLLIALAGFEWSGMVVDSPGTLVQLGSLKSAPVLLSLFGLLVTVSLMALRVRGAILLGIVITALAGLPIGVVKFHGVLSLPPPITATFFKLNLAGAVNLGLFTVIFTFFFLDLFDTIGTLIGVSEQAGFIKNGTLPRAKQALFSDATGTVAGALLGTSTVTSYIESATGIAAGGRSGLANVVTGGLMLLALFLSPLVEMVGGVYPYQMALADGRVLDLQLYPVIAPALIVVGSIMMSSVTRIEWDDPTEALPAFLTIVIMPFGGFSITEGIAFGFISYVLLKLVTRRLREVHLLLAVLAALFVVRYIFLTG